jgi:hypothetical protein
MDILELPILGSRNNNKEKFYSLLTDKPLRNFEGFDLGHLNLGDDLSVYMYFLNQENENYHYLWDIIFPHVIGCILICDWSDPLSIEQNLKSIEYIDHHFNTPLHICSLPGTSDLPDSFIQEELELTGNRYLYTFDPESKDSAKNILMGILNT